MRDAIFMWLMSVVSSCVYFLDRFWAKSSVWQTVPVAYCPWENVFLLIFVLFKCKIAYLFHSVVHKPSTPVSPGGSSSSSCHKSFQTTSLFPCFKPSLLPIKHWRWRAARIDRIIKGWLWGSHTRTILPQIPVRQQNFKDSNTLQTDMNFEGSRQNPRRCERLKSQKPVGYKKPIRLISVEICFSFVKEKC